MQRNTILIIAFVLMVLAQLYVPASMIYSQHRTLEEGTLLKFRTAPVDPYDPFRGKYIRLSYADNVVEVPDPEKYVQDEDVYVTFKEGVDGYALIADVYRTPPDHTEVFLKTTVGYRVYETDSLWITYPFDRFYMEESKALDAETAYQEARTEGTDMEAYVMVAVRKGNAVIENVYIDNKPIREVVIERLKENER